MMKLQINCLLAALLAVSSGNARTFTPTEEFQKAPDLGGMQESNETESTQGQTVPMATAMGEVVHSSNSINSSNSSNSSNSKLGSSAQGQHQRQRQPATTVLKHIVLHQACDFDERGRHRIVMFFPNHCIWTWNNKYVHEGFYYLFKLYQTEAFFFGQFNERLKQYETVPHVWTKD
ncbi:uncharacterized protein LOC117188859 isoform X2 [Drosophila miranda]|uniref:uncharacterized protein LOC117188859 isoform X2 n=1 Tax=Drosophila miranda TaxID=7229 RepID=UPI00143F16BD|nr:uncharacterized protein LOC117188859 isoform X2 [Drosophila miranda]